MYINNKRKKLKESKKEIVSVSSHGSLHIMSSVLTIEEKTKEKYQRNGTYMWLSSHKSLHKMSSMLNRYLPEVKLVRNFVTTKIAKFRGI